MNPWIPEDSIPFIDSHSAKLYLRRPAQDSVVWVEEFAADDLPEKPRFAAHKANGCHLRIDVVQTESL